MIVSFLKKGIFPIPFHMISTNLIMMFANNEMVVPSVKMRYMRRMDVASSCLIIWDIRNFIVFISLPAVTEIGWFRPFPIRAALTLRWHFVKVVHGPPTFPQTR